jgi:hypothetical protein
MYEKPYIKLLDDNGTDCLVHHSTYHDNKWNFKIKPDGTADYNKPNQYASKLERLISINPYKYRVDCLGLPGTAGDSVFDANKVSNRMKLIEEKYEEIPPIKIDFSYETDEHDLPVVSTLRPFESSVGEITIYVKANPKHPYVAALDPSGEGTDDTIMHVFDNITDEQVAVFQSQKPVHECMLQCYGLLVMYNNALVAVEVNITDSPLLMLKQWNYYNFYQRDKRADERHDGVEQKYGFRTTSGNRQSILENLIKWSSTNMDKINDYNTLYEMLSFTRQVKTSQLGGMAKQRTIMAAEAGAKDDLIMGLAIMLKAQEQQSDHEIAEMKKIEGYWTRSELEVGVLKGRIDNAVARGYILDNKDRFEKPFRRSRYAR